MEGNIMRLNFIGTALFQGWSGGAMVLGKLPVLGRPTNLG